MPIRLTIVVDKGVARIKADWERVTKQNIKDFCKFLLNLQHGQCGMDIINAVQSNKENKVGRKIINQLLRQENFLESPIISPEEVGQEYQEG